MTMTNPRRGEPAFNQILAGVLAQLSPRWREDMAIIHQATQVFQNHPGKAADILIHSPGSAPVVIESEYDNEPERRVESEATSRLGMVLAQGGTAVEQAIALRIPVDVQDTGKPDSDVATELRNGKTKFQYALFSLEANGSTRRWPEHGWLRGSIVDLAIAVEQVCISERVVDEGLGLLEEAVRQAAERVKRIAGSWHGDLTTQLGVHLYQQPGEQTTRMAMAVVANAFTFHHALIGWKGVIAPAPKAGVHRLLAQWEAILAINYHPIFRIASDIMAEFRGRAPDQVTLELMSGMDALARKLSALGITTQQELSGRMFQKLITDRKVLASFYTLAPSAALLAELAVGRLELEWNDPAAVKRLRLADFACGTGALIGAAHRVVAAKHRHSGGDDRQLHAGMMENSLIATDIMPSAVHLTASMLASAHPRERFANTRLHVLPYGKFGDQRLSIGALDLLETEMPPDLLGGGSVSIHGDKTEAGQDVKIPHEKQHLVIMNPPFVRPTNHAGAGREDVPVPSFSGLGRSEDEQRLMAKRLGEIRKRLKPPIASHGNAGLGSNFADLAHVKLAPGGVLALILPGSVIQGQSWDGLWRLLRKRYHDITVIRIASGMAVDTALSADTGMADVVILATKNRDNREQPAAPQIMIVNLDHRPASLLEASIIARKLGELERRLGSITEIRLTDDLNSQLVGQVICTGLDNLGIAGTRHAGMIFSAMTGLTEQARLVLPRMRHREAPEVPITRLGELGQRGLYHLDINGTAPRGAFDVVSEGGNQEYPVLWNHDASREKCLVVQPDSRGRVRPWHEDHAVQTWCQTATKLHLNLDFRLNSQPLAACLTPEPSVGGRVWQNFRLSNERWEKLVVLRANSTLGLMLFWWTGSKQQTGRAILTISWLPELPVLDPRA